MTNYTKTTDFAAKDALPSGNSAKIVKGSEIDTEFNNIATASATKANANSAALTGTTTFETISDGTIAITAFVDEDNMASDSATLVPTQQSVKAYVDSQVTAQDLDVTDGSTSIDIDLDSESLGILGGTGIDSTASGTGVTLAIDSTVATLTGSQTLSNKTLSAPVVSGNLTTDGLLDGRDVAADGTKLDGIEALADVTDTANVTAAGALMDSELTDIAAVKALNQGVATTDSPTFAGLTTTADVSFGDNDKAIFGSGGDLQIYHDGTHSVIEDAGTGNLILQSDGAQVSLQSTTELYLTAANNGAVTAYHNGSAKLATTGAGIAVTGTVVSDGLTVDDVVSIDTSSGNAFSSTGNLKIDIDSDDSQTDRTFQITSDGSSKTLFEAKEGGDISFYNSSGTSQSLFWDSSAESLGIGTSNPLRGLDLRTAASGFGNVFLVDTTSGTTGTGGGVIFGSDDGQGTDVSVAAIQGIKENSTAGNQQGALLFTTKNSIAQNLERMRIDSSGNVGIGTASPSKELHVMGASHPEIRLQNTSNNYALDLKVNDTVGEVKASSDMAFLPGGSEAMRIDVSGNLLVGKTASNYNTAGIEIGGANDRLFVTRAGTPVLINRKSSDGALVSFYRDTTPVGRISVQQGSISIGGNPDTGGIYFNGGTDVRPWNQNANTNADNTLFLGASNSRWEEFFCANDTINTSDRNEKQDIEELSDAERRVAVAAKGLLRKFRWIDAVEAKGDDARIHFGIIAQDLQDAFTAEGLDVARYAMWCSDTWTNDDGSEQTRLGVRYSELLAFIISAI